MEWDRSSGCFRFWKPIQICKIVEFIIGVMSYALLDCLTTIAAEITVSSLRTCVMFGDADHLSLLVDPRCAQMCLSLQVSVRADLRLE